MSPKEHEERTSPRHGGGARLRHDGGSRPRHVPRHASPERYQVRAAAPAATRVQAHPATWILLTLVWNAGVTTTQRVVVNDPLTRSQRARCAAYFSWMKCNGKARSMVMTSVEHQGQWDSCRECLERNRVSVSTQQFVDCDSSRSMMDDSVFPERLQGAPQLPPGPSQHADQTRIEQAVSVHHCGEGRHHQRDSARRKRAPCRVRG